MPRAMTLSRLEIQSIKQTKGFVLASFPNEAAIKVHAALHHSVQEHGGRVKEKSFSPSLYERRSAGQVFADTEFLVQIIKLTIEFGAPAAVVSFLIYVRPILLKWLDLKKGRSIELRHGDTSVRIQGENDIDKALTVFKKLSSKNAPDDDQ